MATGLKNSQTEKVGAGIGGGYASSGSNITTPINGGIVRTFTGPGSDEPASIEDGGYATGGNITPLMEELSWLTKLAASGIRNRKSGSINVTGGTIIATGNIGLSSGVGVVTEGAPQPPLIKAWSSQVRDNKWT